MALSHRMEFRQSQALVMTPQLMQAIKLLQLSNLDLIAYVDAELERNPLLERGEGEEGVDAREEPAGANGEDHGANGDDSGEDHATGSDDQGANGEAESEWLETGLETDTS